MISPPVIRIKVFSRFPRIIAAMSTRHGGVSPLPMGMNVSSNVGDQKENVLENRRRFFGGLGIPLERLAVTGQVHSCTIHAVTAPGLNRDCDGLITQTPRLYLSITVADCQPVLMYDPVTETVAAIHSGWRGSAQGIVGAAVRKLGNEFHVDPANLFAWIGPSARSCCYEVGEETAAEFDERYLMRNLDKKFRLDLQSHSLDLLLSNGVKEDHVEVSPDCTIHVAELYHSYRRDKNLSGRMAAVIGIK